MRLFSAPANSGYAARGIVTKSILLLLSQRNPEFSELGENALGKRNEVVPMVI